MELDAECRDCQGLGSLELDGPDEDGHAPGYARQYVSTCSTCDGTGLVESCESCGYAATPGYPNLCRCCAESCPQCEAGTAQHGRYCSACVRENQEVERAKEQQLEADYEEADLHAHWAAHAPGKL